MSFGPVISSWIRRVPRAVIYVVGLLPLIWLVWLTVSGGLGVDPVKTLEHELGKIGLQFLVAVLAITPICRHLRINLIKWRRPLALLGFFYICLHLVVWAILDVQTLGAVWKDIVKRPYITIGMLSFVLMVPLAVTANDRSIRIMGSAGWRRLHKLVYAIVLLGGAHFFMLVKGFQLEPVIYLVVIVLLLALRMRLKELRRWVVVLPNRPSA